MPPIPTEVQAAFWAMMLALLTYVTVQLRRVDSNTNSHNEQLASVKGALSSLSSAVAGSGATVKSVPLYDQLSDPNPDGSLPLGRFNECGEECAAMVISWRHGVSMEADYLRFLLGGASRQPLTTGVDLVRILALCNVRSQVLAPSNGELQAAILKIVNDGRIAIVLGNWIDPLTPHWVLVRNASVNGWSVNDPWGGRSLNVSWSMVQSRYDGSVVEILSRPDGVGS